MVDKGKVPLPPSLLEPEKEKKLVTNNLGITLGPRHNPRLLCVNRTWMYYEYDPFFCVFVYENNILPSLLMIHSFQVSTSHSESEGPPRL